MATRLGNRFRILILRLNRLIWLRRLRCITRLTERQLRSLWQTNQLMSQLWKQEQEQEQKQILRQLEKARPVLPLNTGQQEEQVLMDLQMSSSQLITILQESRSSRMSSSVPWMP